MDKWCSFARAGAVSALMVMMGCAADPEGGGGSRGRMGNAATDPTGLSATNAQTPVTIAGGMQNTGIATGTAGSDAQEPPGMVTMDGCGTSVTAEPTEQPKVDIVWVVDASGSMLDEQIKIGNNITQFANDITSASLDVQIVMMTTSAAIPVICPITDPDPAAATALAGDPRYTFINSLVDSNNALQIAIDSYGQYSGRLRPDAVTHFVIVTDDESNYGGLGAPNQRADQFATDMRGLLGKDFFLHTISSEGPAPCNDPMCMPDPTTGICVFVMLGCGASAPGSTYWELATLTGGLTASICQQDWSSIFTPLTQAIVESAPLPCNYPIPAPPPGQTFEREKVNVEYAGAAGSEVFPGAGELGNCGDENAWYFDTTSGRPSEVLLCPSACDTVAAGGTLNVSFGCATILLE